MKSRVVSTQCAATCDLEQPSRPIGDSPTMAIVSRARRELAAWVQTRNYSGYEPYDLLNSRYLRGRWARRPPCNVILIQLGRRFAGELARRWLQVPPSKNPKALGLFLSGLCDISRCGEDVERQVQDLKRELIQLRSPGEEFLCWGYDWDFYSLRGPEMRAFSPNAIASYFCGTAFLDCWETFHHADARGIAESVGEFIVQRLNRPVDMEQQLCFGYTPTSRGIIYNASALAGAFLARLASHDGKSEYYGLARRCMSFLVAAQRKDGSWPYGANHRQRWIDHFHTGYNLCALLEYSRCSGDHSFGAAVERGYDFYKRKFFTHDGIPKYFQNGLYPIDIHSCSQAILTFAAFADRDPSASECALRTAIWSVQNMQRNDRAFYYQRHRFWTNRAPYMRWGQAWMFRALSGLELASRKVSS